MNESSKHETSDVRDPAIQVEPLQQTRIRLSYYFLMIGVMLLIFPIAFTSMNINVSQAEIVLESFGGLLITSAIVIEIMRFRQESIQKTPQISNPDDLGLAVEQLAQNYELSRAQTNSAFLLSAIFMGAGLLVILLGAIRALLGVTDNTNTLTIVAGVISEFISAGALTLYRSNFLRLNETSSRLYETWKIFAAYKLSKDLPEKQRGIATLSLITALTGVEVKPVAVESELA